MPARDQKVFVIVNNGGCDDVRSALLARNWREVKVRSSCLCSSLLPPAST
jgi:hypothetical protein